MGRVYIDWNHFSVSMLLLFTFSNIIEMRGKYKDAFQKKYNIKLGFLSAFVKATAFALQDQPVVNAVIDELEIVYRDYIDISVAVSTPKVQYLALSLPFGLQAV